MPELVYAIIAILVGFAGLVWSADRFVDGSASIARAAGLSPLIIGLTIVSFGTSAPEILVSINAALEGAGDLAIGNALGSNLANIGLVLGATVMLARLPIQKHILMHEIPILAAVTALGGYVLWDARVDLLDGALLLLTIIPVMAYLIIVKKKDLNPAEQNAEEDIPNMSPKAAWLWFSIGLILLIISSKILVWGATATATLFGVSPLIIGLTVVAVGTSLPELAASIMSAMRGHHDIALGNVIGSNIFNLLAVMSVPAFISPLMMDPNVFSRDYVAMAGITAFLVCWVAIEYFRRRDKTRAGLGKALGLSLLTAYGAYYVWLFQSN